jgi:hypothetical protein
VLLLLVEVEVDEELYPKEVVAQEVDLVGKIIFQLLRV